MSLSPSSSAADVIAHLQGLRDGENIAGMARFGIVTDHALGISTPDLRAIARTIRRNHERALALFESGIREAQLLASYTEELKKITPDQARAQAARFCSWEMVDSWSDSFARAGLGPDLIPEFIADNREFVRRTGFVMMAMSAVHLKNMPDQALLDWLPDIERHATDPRNFVKKAVNWALRQIGKRNTACHGPSLALAERLSRSPDSTARWIGKDAIRDLTGPVALRKLGRG